jgi:hypothetical protein
LLGIPSDESNAISVCLIGDTILPVRSADIDEARGDTGDNKIDLQMSTHPEPKIQAVTNKQVSSFFSYCVLFLAIVIAVEVLIHKIKIMIATPEVSLVKYDNPVLVYRTGDGKSGKQAPGKSVVAAGGKPKLPPVGGATKTDQHPSQTEDILNSILPPKYVTKNQLE